MSKFLINSIIIILIGVTLTITPINIDILKLENLNFSKSEKKEFVVEEDVEENEVVKEINIKCSSSTKSLINPDKVEINIHSNFEISKYIDELKKNIVLEIYKGDTLIDKLDSNVLDVNIDKKDDYDYALNLNIRADDLDLYIGNYSFKIKLYSNSLDEFIKDEKEKEINFLVSYLNDINYKKALYLDKKENFTTLYYLDSDFKYLIPYSKNLNVTKSYIRSILNALLEGDKNQSLYSGKIVPRVFISKLSNGELTLKITSDEANKFSDGSSKGYFAINSFLNTFFELDYIDKISILVDDKKTTTYFHGMDLTKPFVKEKRERLYLGYINSKTKDVFILPFKIENKVSVEDAFEMLKTADISSLSDKDIFSTIPSNINLIDYTINNNILTLNITKEFLENKYKKNNFNLMLDSIVSTYTSFEDIDKVKILVEGKVTNEVIDKVFPEKKYMFLNPR